MTKEPRFVVPQSLLQRAVDYITNSTGPAGMAIQVVREIQALKPMEMPVIPKQDEPPEK